jgi:hypothetical protein
MVLVCESGRETERWVCTCMVLVGERGNRGGGMREKAKRETES